MNDLGETSFVIGLNIHRDKSPGTVGLLERAYVKIILSRFGMHNCAFRMHPLKKVTD